MTCKEKLEREFPDANIDEIINNYCPHNFEDGYAAKPSDSECKARGCRACWSREYNPKGVNF